MAQALFGKSVGEVAVVNGKECENRRPKCRLTRLAVIPLAQE